MENIEIKPIFGSHEAINHSQAQETILAWKKRRLIPGYSRWDQTVSQKLESFGTSLIAVDGIHPSFPLEEVFYASPEYIFDLPPSVLVAADMNWGKLARKPSELNLVEQATRLYWLGIKPELLVDPNRKGVSTKLGSVISEVLPEIGILYALFTAADYAGFGVSDTLSKLMYADMARIFINRVLQNPGFRTSTLLPTNLLIAANMLTRPLLAKMEDVDFRNALIATKLADIKSNFAEQFQNHTPVAVLGSSHAGGTNLWNNEEKRKRILRNGFSKIHSLVKEVPGKGNFETEAIFFFAETIIWRFEGQPKSFDLREVTKHSRKETFISPTVTELIRQASL